MTEEIAVCGFVGRKLAALPPEVKADSQAPYNARECEVGKLFEIDEGVFFFTSSLTLFFQGLEHWLAQRFNVQHKI